MKGIVFNLAEAVVTKQYGEATWETLLDAAGLDGSYTSLGNYPDEDLFKIVGAASSALKLPADAVVRTLGKAFVPLLAAGYPEFFKPHRDARGFILTLNDVIHPEVRKLYPGADVPDFEFETLDGGGLVLVYRSPRKLCALAEGLIEGAAEHYGESVELRQAACLHRGDRECRIECRFRKKGA